LSFDHGAQYFTARDGRFKRYVQSWLDDGLVQPWNGRIVVIEKGVIKADKTGDNRYVAVPGMSSLGKHIATDLSVQLETRLAPPTRSDGKWSLTNDDGVALGQFDVVVVAVPSHQAASLLVAAPQLAELSSSVKMNGCWALMLAFEESLSVGFDGVFVHESPLSWIANNNSKPGRGGRDETWVVHAKPEWTEAHIDDSPDQVGQWLLDEFWTAIGRRSVKPMHLETKLWRYAIPALSVGTGDGIPQKFGGSGSLGGDATNITERCLFDDRQWIGVCGDWCAGARVEGAFLSGLAIAGRILGRLNATTNPSSKGGQQLALF
jgi:predicted NAD/FAD-dependent oxidoreductase